MTASGPTDAAADAVAQIILGGAANHEAEARGLLSACVQAFAAANRHFEAIAPSGMFSLAHIVDLLTVPDLRARLTGPPLDLPGSLAQTWLSPGGRLDLIGEGEGVRLLTSVIGCTRNGEHDELLRSLT